MNRPSKNSIWRIGGLLLAAFAGGCDSSASRSDRGFLAKTFADEFGHTTRYVLFVPESYQPPQKLPVILFLNGQGESGDDGLLQVSNNFGIDLWTKRDHFPFLAVCPQKSWEGSWSPGSKDARRALAILEEVIGRYGADRDRVYLTGVSAGGAGVFSLAEAHSELFAALVPISATGSGTLQSIENAGLPVWGFYNGRDNDDVVTSHRSARTTLLKAGLSPLMTEFDQVGHNAWHAYDNPFLYSWLLQQNRSKNTVSGRFRFYEPEELLETWQQVGEGGWAVKKGTVEGKSGKNAERSLLCSPVGINAAELHLDVFLTPSEIVKVATLSEKGERISELSIALPETGLGSLVRFDGNPSTTFDSVGQRGLAAGWNDIRLAHQQGRFTVHLNGWLALDVTDFGQEQPFRWGLATGTKEHPSRWRFVRTRGRSESFTPEEAP